MSFAVKNVQKYQLCCSPPMSILFICVVRLPVSTKSQHKFFCVRYLLWNSTYIFIKGENINLNNVMFDKGMLRQATVLAFFDADCQF